MAESINPTTPPNQPPVKQGLDIPMPFKTVDVPRQVGYTGYGKSQYDIQPLTFENLQNLNEIRAKEQSALDKLGNGLVNMTSSAFTGALESTVGAVYGVTQSLVTGNPDDIWNNEFGQAMDSINEAARESNPFYYSEAEKKASLLGSMGYQNFWFDKVLGGAGYTIGSLLAGYGMSNLFKMGKAAQLAQLGQEAAVGGELAATTEGLGKAALTKQRWDLTKEIALGTTLAHGESAMEARQTYEETKDYYFKARELGDPSNPNFDPQYAQFVNLTDEQIEKYAVDAGNTNYLINMPITGGTNMLLLGKFLNPGKREAIKAYNQIGTRTLESGAIEYFDKLAAQKGKAYLNAGSKFLEGFVPESIQEGAQYASNIASQEFVKQHDVGKEDWATSFYEGVAEGLSRTFTDKEGLESILVGGIVGGPFGLKGARSERLAKEANTKELVDALNADPTFLQSNKFIGDYLASVKTANEGEDYLKQGDLFNAKNKTDQALNRYIKAQIDKGSVDYFKTRIESLKDIDDAEIAQHFGEGTTKEDLDKILTKTAELEKLNDDLTVLYGMSGGTEEQRVANAKIRDRFFFAASTIKDIEARTKNIEQEILDKKDVKASNLIQLRNNIYSLAKEKAPKDFPSAQEYNDYIKDLKINAAETYNKALRELETENPVDAADIVNLFADLNKLTERKLDYIKYYNALQDPKKALELVKGEEEALAELQDLAMEASNLETQRKNAEKEAALPEELINDVFKKDVAAQKVVQDSEGKQVDLAAMSDADLRGLREDLNSQMLLQEETPELRNFYNAVDGEINSRENVSADTLKEELRYAQTPADVEKVLQKAEDAGFTVSSEAAKNIYDALAARQETLTKAAEEGKKAAYPFKDVREFLNTFAAVESGPVLNSLDKLQQDKKRKEAQQKLDTLLIYNPNALNEVTLKITKNPEATGVTTFEGSAYGVSKSPLKLAIQYLGQDIAYIPYYGKFATPEGQLIDPTLMTYEQWLKVFRVSVNEERGKGTRQNFQDFVAAYQAAKNFFVYVNENLAKGKDTYTNEELKTLLNPSVNIGNFVLSPKFTEDSLLENFQDERPLYRNSDGNVLIVDTNSPDPRNYKTVQQITLDRSGKVKEEYKEALEKLAERKASGKIHNNKLLQRYVVLVEHPYGTVTLKGDTKKYEWVPVNPAPANVNQLLDVLKGYQADKTKSPKEMTNELNSQVFFALRSGWDVGLYFSPDYKEFTLEFKFGAEPSVFANAKINAGTTVESFIKELNESLQDPARAQVFQGQPAVKEIGLITADNFKQQLPTQLADLSTDEALTRLYAAVDPNVKAGLSFRINYNTPVVKATEPLTPTQPSSTQATNIANWKKGDEIIITVSGQKVSTYKTKILDIITDGVFYSISYKDPSGNVKTIDNIDKDGVYEEPFDAENGIFREVQLVTPTQPVATPAAPTVSEAKVADVESRRNAELNKRFKTPFDIEPVTRQSIEQNLKGSEARKAEIQKQIDQIKESIVAKEIEILNKTGIQEYIERAKVDKEWVFQQAKSQVDKQLAATGKVPMDKYAPFSEIAQLEKDLKAEDYYTNRDLADFNAINAKYDAELGQPTTVKAGRVNPRGQVKLDPTKLDPGAQSTGEIRQRERDLTGAFAYIRSVFGEAINVQELQALQDRLSDGTILYGDFKNNLIRLSRFSPVGTEYHEAFHGVFRSFLSDPEIDYYLALAKQEYREELKKKGISITKQAAEFKKDFLAKNPYSKFSDQELFDLMLEEYMADKFMAYKNSGKTEKKSGIAGIFQTLWERFKNLLNIFVDSKNADAFDGLFKKIDSGAYKNKNVVSNRFTGTILPAEISLYAGTTFEKDANGNILLNEFNQERVIPVYLPEHTANQIIGTIISQVYSKAKANPTTPTDRLINEALDNFHANFDLDNRADAIEASGNQPAIDLYYNIEFALNKDSYINAPDFAKSPRTEISNAVKAALKSFKVEEIAEENTEEGDDTKPKGGDTESAEKNRELSQENLGGFKNLSKKVRAYIALTTYTTSLNDFFGVSNVFPEEDTITLAVDTKRVYNGLAKATQNSLTSNEVMTKLVHYRNVSQESRYVIDRLLNDLKFPLEDFLTNGTYSETQLNPDNLDLYSAFVKAFNLHSHEHEFTQHDFNLGITKTYASNRKTADQKQFEDWSSTYVKNWQGWGKTPQENLAYVKTNIVPSVSTATNILTLKTSEELSDAEVLDRMSTLKEGLEKVGIKLSDGYLKFLVLNNPNYTAMSAVQKSYVESFNYNMLENQAYVVSTLDELVKHMNSGKNPFQRDYEQVKKDGKDTQVEYGLVGRILTLAKNNEMFDETLSPNSFLNAENKTIYGLQKPTADSIITLAIARNRLDLLPLNYQDEYFKDHYLLTSPDFQKVKQYIKLVREDGSRAIPMRVNAFGKLEADPNQESEEGVTFGGYKARELALAEYSHYLDTRFDGSVGRGAVSVRPVILDIMENSKSLDMVPLPVIQTITKDGKITDNFKEAILKEIKREWDRIQRVKAEGLDPAVKIEGYNWGADPESMTKLRGYKFWQFQNLLEFDNSPLRKELEAAGDDTNFSDYSERIMEQIDKYFTAKIEEHLESLAKLGVVKREMANGKVVYINVLLDTRYGRRKKMKSGTWVSETAEERKKILDAMKAEKLGNPFTSEYAGDNIAQVFLSNYLNRLSYNQLIKGDAAEVVKNPIDWFKRAKARNASGDSLYSEEMPETRVSIIGQRGTDGKIEDPSMNFNVTTRLLDMNNPEDAAEWAEVEKSILENPAFSQEQKEKELADLRKKGKVDIADAQGWLSTKAYKNYLRALGRLTKQTLAIYEKIEKGESITPKEQALLKEENVMANSLKVVYHDGRVFYKLSVQNLSKEEVSVVVDGERVARPGMEIKFNMMQQMDEHNIDLLIPPSASKMLTQNVVELDQNGLFNVSNAESQVSTISNLFARLQQENPSNKTEITNTTQMQNIIEVEQDKEQEITYPFHDGIKNVKDLLEHYDAAQAQKVERSYVPAKNVLFALQKGKVNPRMGRLAKIMRENLIKTGATGQLLDFFQLDEAGVPMFDFANMPHTTAKFESMYNAHFNKVFNQKIPGYKTTLQSGYGHKIMYYENADGTQTIVNRAMFDANASKYMADYKSGRLKTRDLAYNKPRLDKNGKEIARYSEFVMAAHFAEQFGLKPGDVIPEEIAYMFGLRIPSQDKHSAMSLKLVDILPSHAGSNAVFPHELVKLTGSDFDIDSFYIHRPAHYTKRVNGKLKFMQYGNAEDSAFDQFVEYYKDNNFVKLLVEENLDKDLTRPLSREEALMAMKDLGLPTTEQEFNAETKQKGELNPAVLDNQILNAKIVLHTNPAIRKVASTPATTEEVEVILGEIAKAKGFDKYQEMDVNYDVSSLDALMQALDSNRAGQESIGAAVNATQIFGRLAEFKIKIGARFLENLPIINGYRSEGYLSYKTQDGKRIMDLLSTLTSAMTDNPKYGFVNKLGLTIDVLSNVSNLVSLGYSLRDALFLVNQDYVKRFTQFEANKRNPLRPLGEKFTNTGKYFESLKQDILNQLKQLAPNEQFDLESNEFKSEDLKTGLSKIESEDTAARITYLVTNYKALVAYESLEPITRSFSTIGNVIKITKGTGSTFEEEANILDNLNKLKVDVKKINGKWEVVKLADNKIFPNIIEAFKNHKLTKANLATLADKRANTGTIALSQTQGVQGMIQGVWKNLKSTLINYEAKKNATKKAVLSFLTVKAYALQQKNTILAVDNLPSLIYKMEDRQTMLIDEYKELSQKYPELVGQSPALFSLGFRPETSNGFMGIGYNSTKGNPEFENRLTNDFENLYAHEQTRGFVVKLFNYLIAKDALQFRNNSFINIMPSTMFRAYSKATKKVLELYNNPNPTDQDFERLFGVTETQLNDEFAELYVRDYSNSSELVYFNKPLIPENLPVTKNEDGSITLDLFKGWESLSKDDLMVALQNSVDPDSGEEMSHAEIKKNLKDKLTEENIQKFIENLDNLMQLFRVKITEVGGKKITKVLFRDGFKAKDAKGIYVLKEALDSTTTKEGIEYSPAKRVDGLKAGVKATYVLKQALGDKYNKVLSFGMGLEEAEKISQDKLRKPQAVNDVNGEEEPVFSQNAATLKMAEASKAKKQGKSFKFTTSVKKIISGFQTGVDTLGLEIAKELGLQTGGTAPIGFLQEGAKNPTGAASYGVQQISAEAQADYTKRTGKTDPYTARTEQNVKNSDGTVYFFTPGDTMGRDATKREATKLGKPFIENPTATELNTWLIKNNVQILNVAGNRGSKLTSEKSNEVKTVLKQALTEPIIPEAKIQPASAVDRITASKADAAESSTFATDPDVLPSKEEQIKALVAAYKQQGLGTMDAMSKAKQLTDAERIEEFKKICNTGI